MMDYTTLYHLHVLRRFEAGMGLRTIISEWGVKHLGYLTMEVAHKV